MNKFSAGKTHIQIGEFLRWASLEPQSIVWLPVLHRLISAETASHNVRCICCREVGFSGFRYRSLKVFTKQPKSIFDYSNLISAFPPRFMSTVLPLWQGVWKQIGSLPLGRILQWNWYWRKYSRCGKIYKNFIPETFRI